MTRLSILFLCLALPAAAEQPPYGHMMGWGYGGGAGMMFAPVLWLIVLGLVVAGVIWIVRRLDGHDTKPSGAMAELDMRLARGEIDAEEYKSRKALLTS